MVVPVDNGVRLRNHSHLRIAVVLACLGPLVRIVVGHTMLLADGDDDCTSLLAQTAVASLGYYATFLAHIVVVVVVADHVQCKPFLLAGVRHKDLGGYYKALLLAHIVVEHKPPDDYKLLLVHTVVVAVVVAIHHDRVVPVLNLFPNHPI